MSEKDGNKLPVIAAISGPFENAARLRGFDQVLRDLVLRPEPLKKLLKITTKVAVEYGGALIDSGASVFTLVDGTSSPEYIGPKFYSEFSQTFEREVIGKLDTLTVLHICTQTTSILAP